MGRRATAVVLLVSLAGCSLFTSLDGFSTGYPPLEAGTEDGPRDAIVSEAGDAGGPEDGPADGGFACAQLSPAPRLCVDFGNGRVYSNGVPTATDFEAQEGTPLPRLDTTFATSPPASALFELSSVSPRSTLMRTFPNVVATRIELAMSMRIEGPADSALDLMELRWGSIDAAIYLRRSGASLDIRQTYALPDGGMEGRVITLPVTMLAARWMRMAWVVETGATPSLTVRVDGALVLDRSPLDQFNTTGAIGIVAGCTDVFTAGAVKVWVDDVVASF